MPHWTDDEHRLLGLCNLVAGSLSLAGSVVVFVLYFAFYQSRSKKIVHRLILYLALCHCIMSLGMVLGTPLKDASHLVCAVLAPVRYYFSLASFVWTCAIATEVLHMWYRTRINQFGEPIMPSTSALSGTSTTTSTAAPFIFFKKVWYHIVAWVGPVLVTIWPIIFKVNVTGLWQCSYNGGNWAYLFLAFVLVSCLYCLVVYCLALFCFGGNRTYESGTSSYSLLQESRRTELKFRVTGFLLTFIVTRVVALTAHVVGSIDNSPSTPLFVLTALSATLVPLTGFLDSVVYAWDQRVLNAVFDYCGRCWWTACNGGSHQRSRAIHPSHSGDSLSTIVLTHDPEADGDAAFGDGGAGSHRYSARIGSDVIGTEEGDETFAFSDSD